MMSFSIYMYDLQAAIEKALVEAEEQGIEGQSVTPFLLARISELTGGRSLAANVALIKHNAQVRSVDDAGFCLIARALMHN